MAKKKEQRSTDAWIRIQESKDKRRKRIERKNAERRIRRGG